MEPQFAQIILGHRYQILYVKDDGEKYTSSVQYIGKNEDNKELFYINGARQDYLGSYLFLDPTQQKELYDDTENIGDWYIAHPDEILNNSSSNGNENRRSVNEENVNDPTAPMNGGKKNRKKSRKSKKQKKSRRVRK